MQAGIYNGVQQFLELIFISLRYFIVIESDLQNITVCKSVFIMTADRYSYTSILPCVHCSVSTANFIYVTNYMSYRKRAYMPCDCHAILMYLSYLSYCIDCTCLYCKNKSIYLSGVFHRYNVFYIATASSTLPNTSNIPNFLSPKPQPWEMKT